MRLAVLFCAAIIIRQETRSLFTTQQNNRFTFASGHPGLYLTAQWKNHAELMKSMLPEDQLLRQLLFQENATYLRKV